MRITIELFAILRELAGTRQLELHFSEPVNVAGVAEAVQNKFPALKPYAKITTFAVNGEYARLNDPLQDGDTVAFLPPISGGAHD